EAKSFLLYRFMFQIECISVSWCLLIICCPESRVKIKPGDELGNRTDPDRPINRLEPRLHRVDGNPQLCGDILWTSSFHRRCAYPCLSCRQAEAGSQQPLVDAYRRYSRCGN